MHSSLLWSAFGQRATRTTLEQVRLTLISANLALVRWLLRAFTPTVAFLLAEVACPRERTVDARVGAVGLVVPNFTTIEALAGHATASAFVPGLGAVTSEVSIGTAAKKSSQ